ncbi:hypothetical protein RHGRI_037877 [Rhododendron griersonianum]|uniref:PCI domain-containing protein n=1 Tax=Rhododendron griersonianum TaxID=479676 RepID=A0AAV6HTC9_9ERIC|nr:hypothetical protein RHGRI_037877 [Rhododendron griersonianum]
MDDPFIRNYIEDLLKNVRTQVLLKLIKPYTRIRIPFISKELNVPEKDVEELLVSLILDNRIHGHIDQVNRLLERGDRLHIILLFVCLYFGFINFRNSISLSINVGFCQFGKFAKQLEGNEKVHCHR